MMKRLLFALALLNPTIVFAQWQVPAGNIPVGRGAGVTGFNSVTGSAGVGGKCLIDTNPPTFGACPGPVSLLGFGGVPNTSSVYDGTKAATNNTAFAAALATGRPVSVPYNQFGYSINSVALSSGQSIVCENRATIIYSHSAAAFAISSLGPETSIENCTVLMAGGPVGSTAFLFKTAAATVTVVRLENVSCYYSYACFDDEGTNNVANLRAINVYATQTYGLPYRIRNSNGFIHLTNLQCDFTNEAGIGLVTWGCGRFSNGIGIQFDGLNVATGTGVGVPVLTAANAWWVDNTQAVWIEGTVFADNTGGNGILLDGNTYLLGGGHVEASINLGTQVTISNTAQVNLSNVFCYGANNGVTGAAAAKTGCDFNAVTLANISNVYEKNATGTGVTIQGASSIQIGNLTASNNTTADFADTATGVVGIDQLNGRKYNRGIAAPSSPASGTGLFWFDSTDLRYHDKNAAGTIGTTVVADTGAANNFLTAISAAGVVSKAQPSISNLSGLGTGVATALGINIGSAGAPVLFNGALGTPSAGVLTNATGTASGLTAGTVTTNANLTGPITSVGNATSIASQTGSGSTLVTNTSPTLAGTLQFSLGGTAVGKYGATSNYNVFSLNNSIALNGSLGMFGGASGDTSILYLSAPGAIHFYFAGVDSYNAQSASFSPTIDLTPSLGDASHRWNGVFTSTLATAKGTVAVANGLNSNIATPVSSFVRLTGPTGAFSVGGFTLGVDGYHLTIYNTVAQTMTIVNEDASSTAANRIKTLTGGNVVLRATATSSATFVYDTTDSRWILIATN